MSEDIKRVLALLAQRALDGGVPVSYLSKHLDIPIQRVLLIVEMLERAGYVRVQRLGRIVLVTLASPGHKVSGAWREKQRENARLKRIPNRPGTISAILLTLIIGFLGLWSGLFAQTGDGKPVASVPLRSTVLHASKTHPDIPTGTATLAPAETAPPIPTETPTATATVTRRPASATPSAQKRRLVPESGAPQGFTPLPTVFTDTPHPSTLPPQPTPIPTPVPLLGQPADVVNIVLMGTDTTVGNWRTDTLILVSVRQSPPSVSMLSIPRDLYVYVPGWGMSRINAADYHGENVGYPGGGPGLVKATIEYNLGIRVHYFARVDFQGFVSILDNLGGVDVVVDCELHDTFPDPAAEDGETD